jgi:hypothetical protein
MSKLIHVLLLGIVGLVGLVASGPTITRLAQALVPLVLVTGIVVALVLCVLYFTRR